ncbi:MAG TPA: hypothetical protein VMW75_23910 [Thermoanaerobaculia bacterium]|nr:hypothetical protein [Thermoanaerobaculia bacterium]
MTPCRVFDTRTTGPQTNGSPLNGGPSVFFRIQGYCGIPNGAQAVTLNLTIVSPSRQGDMRLYPANVTPHATDPSTINYDAGEVALANGAIVPLAPVSLSTDKDLQIVIGMQGPGTVHAIVDVTGYFQ